MQHPSRHLVRMTTALAVAPGQAIRANFGFGEGIDCTLEAPAACAATTPAPCARCSGPCCCATTSNAGCGIKPGVENQALTGPCSRSTCSLGSSAASSLSTVRWFCCRVSHRPLQVTSGSARCNIPSQSTCSLGSSAASARCAARWPSDPRHGSCSPSRSTRSRGSAARGIRLPAVTCKSEQPVTSVAMYESSETAQ